MNEPESNLSFDEMKNQFDTATNTILKLRNNIDHRMNELKLMEASWNEKLELMQKEAGKAKNMIKLDVGGKIFKVSKEVLLGHKDTYFYAMLSSGEFLPDEEGAYCIDRNPKLFPYILDYLRYGTVDLTDLTETQQKQLSIEADFYMIDMNPSLNSELELFKNGGLTFTTLGATGRKGPKKVGHHYNNNPLLKGKVTLSKGIQSWIVPSSGDFLITCAGASGGNNKYANTNLNLREGYGAVVSGVFTLMKGTVLNILVGQRGQDATNGAGSGAGGGGGGSFVVNESEDKPLIVAGGGNGCNWYSWTVESPG